MNIIGQIFNEVIAIFGINEKEADGKGLWIKFEESLQEIFDDYGIKKDLTKELSECCRAEIKVHQPPWDGNPEHDLTDPIEYCDKYGKRIV